MPDWPHLSGDEVVKAPEPLGFAQQPARQPRCDAQGLARLCRAASLGGQIGTLSGLVRQADDPDYGAKLDQLGEAADAFGRRLSIAFTTTPQL
jgi:hypothetical protein